MIRTEEMEDEQASSTTLNDQSKSISPWPNVYFLDKSSDIIINEYGYRSVINTAWWIHSRDARGSDDLRKRQWNEE